MPLDEPPLEWFGAQTEGDRPTAEEVERMASRFGARPEAMKAARYAANWALMTRAERIQAAQQARSASDHWIDEYASIPPHTEETNDAH